MAPESRIHSVLRAAGKPKREVAFSQTTPVAAVGVAPAASGKRKGYRLAVRLFGRRTEQQAFILKGVNLKEDELDLVAGVRYKPRLILEAGRSCGHYRITAGTVGGFVEDDERYYILSNNHVLANSNSCFVDDPILQPGPIDIKPGQAFHVIGKLDRWHPLARERKDGVDAAIARFSDKVTEFVPWDYKDVGRIQRQPVADRFAPTRVIKRGRTTVVTRGQVSAYTLDGVAIDYGTKKHPAVVTFDGVIEFVGDPPGQPFSQPGDSGSFIIDRDTMKPYALLFGGALDNQGIDRTLAHFMPDVLSALKVRLVQ